MKIRSNILSEAILFITNFLAEGDLAREIVLPGNLDYLGSNNVAKNNEEAILAYDFIISDEGKKFPIRVFLKRDIDTQLKVKKIDRNAALNFGSLSVNTKKMTVIGSSSGLSEQDRGRVQKTIKEVQGNAPLILTYGMTGNSDGVNAAVNQLSGDDQLTLVGILSTESSERDLLTHAEYYRFDAGILVVSPKGKGGYATTSWLTMYLSAENVLLVGGGNQSFRELCYALQVQEELAIASLSGLIPGICASDVFQCISSELSSNNHNYLDSVKLLAGSKLSEQGTQEGFALLEQMNKQKILTAFSKPMDTIFSQNFFQAKEQDFTTVFDQKSKILQQSSIDRSEAFGNVRPIGL